MKKIIISYALMMLISLLIAGCTYVDYETSTNSSQENTNIESSIESTEEDTSNEESTKTEYELAKDECESQGGELIGCETLTGFACSLPTGDGGTPCSNSDECEQQCVAPENCEPGDIDVEGICAEWTYLVCDGVQTIEDGQCEAIMIS